MSFSPAASFAKNADGAPLSAARFRHIDAWIFDLDNTLYAADGPIWRNIDQRMTAYICGLFGIDGFSARALQKHYYRAYGTTLRGLAIECGVRPQEFLSFVHDIDRSSLKPVPRLAAAIRALPGRKFILTNGSREHAHQTTRRLRLDHLFDDVFDVMDADLHPKPDPRIYARFFEKLRIDPRSSAMIEDIARNLEEPHKRGATTILVLPPAAALANRETWENPRGDEGYVDFATRDLSDFLERTLRALNLGRRAV